MNARVDRLRASLEEPLLVTNPVNVRYLIGFQSSNPALLVEPERLRLFSDFRYAETARALRGVDFEQVPRNLLKGVAERLEGPIAFESDFITYAGYETLSGGGLELVPRSGLVERLRRVKDADELAAIRRAADVTNGAYERLAGESFVGRTERDLAWRMEQFFHELGGDEAAFDVIVASGPNAARPHTTPGDRAVEQGETIIIDAGAKIDGYCADCTRTFVAGSLDAELASAYDVCSEAQLAGLEAVAPGVAGSDADSAARGVIESAGHGDHFGHGLGHGVGLQVHEAPVLRPESEDVLEPGNVVTVEPGIYLPGRGGVRIEDLVVVTEDGCETLTTFTKEAVTVG